MAKVKPLFGWRGPKEAAKEWERLAHLFVPFQIETPIGSPFKDSKGKRVVLWEAVREVLGKDLPNIAQESGDCTSFGTCSAIDHLALWEIARLKQSEKFRKSFQPFNYGASRVLIGGGRLGSQEGSLGSWAAQAAVRYGVLAADEASVPKYSGKLANAWGKSGPPANFVTTAKPFTVKSAAQIRSYEQARDALCNGYSIAYSTNRGHQMDLKLDAATGKGWHYGTASWPHCRCVIGVDDADKRPGVYVWNSWGPSSHLPNKDGPPGGGWFDAEEFDKDVRKSGTECYSFSLFSGFPSENSKPSFLLA